MRQLWMGFPWVLSVGYNCNKCNKPILIGHIKLHCKWLACFYNINLFHIKELLIIKLHFVQHNMNMNRELKTSKKKSLFICQVLPFLLFFRLPNRVNFFVWFNLHSWLMFQRKMFFVDCEKSSKWPYNMWQQRGINQILHPHSFHPYTFSAK